MKVLIAMAMRQLIHKNAKAQATTELAITGVIIIMLLGYLVQQGFIYSSRQALEMYTFTKALELSRDLQQGVQLLVIRDITIPSFFTGINRQRLQAFASIDYNPYMAYNPDVPQDIPNRYFIQIGDAMIERGVLLEVPPLRMRINNTDWRWVSSPATLAELITIRNQSVSSSLVNITTVTKNYISRKEKKDNLALDKRFESEERKILIIDIKDSNEIINDYRENDWENRISSVEIDANTLPSDLVINTEETVIKSKTYEIKK